LLSGLNKNAQKYVQCVGKKVQRVMCDKKQQVGWKKALSEEGVDHMHVHDGFAFF
jgi:hypothetical protein